MVFSSFQFIIFFLIFIFLIYFFSNYQRLIIIISSLIFYAYWKPIYVIIILYLIILSYLFIKKNFSLKFSIPILLLPLIYFKYSNFIFDILNISESSILKFESKMPLGISFITFTVIALVVDIKKKIFIEKIKLNQVSEFILYFPQLIAGPILRANELIPLLKEKIILKQENIKFGILLFLIGFVKKVFFADSIANIIDPIFLTPGDFDNKYILVASLLFPIQIYFDFSGYVDMALGISKILGIQLPINFDAPYLSKSLTDFWRKWHITLSSWFRDYLFIPIGGSRSGIIRTNLNLIITMTIAGLWHGASWNFVLWGFMHGFILSLEKINIIKKIRFYLPSFISIFINCFIVFNLWIVFRITDFNNLFLFINKLYSFQLIIFDKNIIYSLLLLVLSIYLQKYDNQAFLANLSKKINFISLIVCLLSILISGFLINLGTSENFIYFDF